jgi:hypothetical protein
MSVDFARWCWVLCFIPLALGCGSNKPPERSFNRPDDMDDFGAPAPPAPAAAPASETPAAERALVPNPATSQPAPSNLAANSTTSSPALRPGQTIEDEFAAPAAPPPPKPQVYEPSEFDEPASPPALTRSPPQIMEDEFADPRVAAKNASGSSTQQITIPAELWKTPEADDLEKARRRLKIAFADEVERLKKGDKRSRHRFASALLNSASQASDDPAALFVLLETARDYAAQAGDCQLALQAVEGLERHFEIDSFEQRRSAVATASPELLPYFAPQNELVYQVAGTLLGEALERDDLTSARQLADVLLESAKRSGNRAALHRAQAMSKAIDKIRRSENR